MTEKVFISKIRTLRNHMQERLYKCENQDLKDKITRKLEMYNIMLQEFGYQAYDDRKQKKNRF